nr:MAG TPA: hypothetical protein [Crassvirales sp.]
MWVIAILIIILTLSILKDTHVEVYYRCFGPAGLQEEYDVIVPIWMALIITVLGLLPVANTVLFVAFIIYYVIHAGWNPNKCDNYTHVFSLRGDNIVTKGLLKVKNLLCKEI